MARSRSDQQQMFFQDIATFLDFGRHLLDLADEAQLPQSKTGTRQTPRNAARDACIEALASLWMECLGTEPSVSWNNHDQEDTGPFVRFCNAVFTRVDPDQNRGLASAVRRVLRGLK